MKRISSSTATILAILATMLISARQLAFAQKDAANNSPHPTAVVSPEWERVREALKKAKPMPDPKNALRPNGVTEHGGLAAFDPKTGAVVRVPAAVARPHVGKQRIEGKPGVLPTNSTGANPKLRKSNVKEGTSHAEGAASDVSATPATATAPSPLYYPYSFPFNSYVKLLMRFNDGTNDYFYTCSASAASDFHLVSAGHCIYNHDIRNDSSNVAGFAVEVWAWAAHTDVVDPVDWNTSNYWPDFPYGVAKMTWEVTYDGWIDSSDLNWDFTFITLDRRLGDHTGWIGREWDTTTTALNFSGYPTQTPYVSKTNPFQYPGFDADNVTEYTCCRIKMDAYTYGGHSGGPVWRFDSPNRYLEGVNSTSDRAGSAEATLLTSQIETDLENAISNDQAVRPPGDLAQVIEYVFNGSSKGLGQTSTEVGYSFPLTLNAFNAGYSDAGDTIADIYLSYDATTLTNGQYIGTFDFGDLGANTYLVQTTNVTIPTNFFPGNGYYVGYILKSANSQYGTDKNSVVIEAQKMDAYCNNDAYEPDDISGNASVLTSGSTQNHSICVKTDWDWAKFTVSSSTTAVTLSTSGYSGGDTTMTLYDSSLNQIDYNDDNGVNHYSTINRTCGVSALAPGTYYVQIQSYQNARIIPYYTLSLNTTPCATAPAITSANNTTFALNSFGSFTVTTTGSPTPPITEQGGLPNGVSFLDNGNGTGTLSGTPTVGGTFNITFTATNSANHVTQNFTLNVVGGLTISPSAFNYGTVYLNSHHKLQATVTNDSSSNVTISGVTITPGTADADAYKFTGYCHGMLKPHQSCIIAIALQSDAVGALTATVNIADNAPGSPQHLSLTANVINPIAVFSPSPLKFGVVTVNSPKTLPLQLTNTGQTDLAVGNFAISGAHSGGFSQTNNCPATLPATMSCTIEVTFAPAAKGSGSGTLTVTDNVAKGKSTVLLLGTGH